GGGAQRLERAVGRAVVDQDDAGTGLGLRRQAGHRVGDEGVPVVEDRHHGHPRRAHPAGSAAVSSLEKCAGTPRAASLSARRSYPRSTCQASRISTGPVVATPATTNEAPARRSAARTRPPSSRPVPWITARPSTS